MYRDFDPSVVQAILFDLDGTLIDTDDAIIEAWSNRLRWISRDPRRLLRHLLMASETPTNAFITLLDMLHMDDNLFSLNDRLRRLRGLRTPANFLAVDGVVDMVHTLCERYPLSVVTTRSRHDTWAFLGQYCIRDCFRVVTTHEDTVRLKPHPEPIRRTAQILGVPVEHCLMVGDTTVDILAARRAGAMSVGVLCGFGERAELERAGANVILKSTAELGTLFEMCSQPVFP
ncbi:MAG: HAD family hydrolase [Anaerolineae bacterium]|jgi:phosphoglycolate phosphatase|nr:HAD family hydrolase [Anaerolineae bacterium]MDH7474169.1 HAD family hydrolase [Anaerolineae bacterium]